MRTTSIVAILAAMAHQTFGSPAPVEGSGVANTTAEATGMIWVGQAVVGGPNVTLTGDIDSIRLQLLKINPDYNAWDFDEYRTDMEAQGVTRDSPLSVREQLEQLARRKAMAKRGNTVSLEKRDYINCNPVGDRVGNWAMQCYDDYSRLLSSAGTCYVPARAWVRVGCTRSCGIFLQNPGNSYQVGVPCRQIAQDFIQIADECQYCWDDYVCSLKGQKFRDSGNNHNVVAKNNDCAKEPSIGYY